MSLSASMWTSVTGLLVHGEKMNVVGNNIANVNTVAFKGSRMDFEDFVNQDVYSAAGPTQVGRGVSIGAIYGNFAQGSFENSTEATDIAISGKGFFKVKPKDSNTEYFTRAGNYRFDADGYLVDPHGYVLQGWQIQRANPSLASTGSAAGSGSGTGGINLKGSGVPVDIKLDGFTSQPKQTNNMTAILNLDSRSGDNTTDTVDPFFAMFKNWDATNLQVPAIGQTAYAHQQTMTVFDEGGTAHKITIYLDQVNTNVTNGTGTENHWEYMVTMDPADDLRDFATPPATGDTMNAAKRGILMTGTLTFGADGQFMDMSAYVPTVGATGNALNTWTQAPISNNGYPMFAPNFSGREGASTPWAPTGIGTTLNPIATPFLIELNLGLNNASNTWVKPTADKANSVGVNANNLSGMGTNARRESSSSVSFESPSAELFAKQDGYTFGYLSTVYVDRDGVLYGKYSNGQNLALYQITLYDVPSQHNLRREGGNLFSATNESGDVVSGPANSAGFGSIYGNSLEQSNVDLATEFVQMITTQRGFQANSKSITTVDTMLETVIGMKR